MLVLGLPLRVQGQKQSKSRVFWGLCLGRGFWHGETPRPKHNSTNTVFEHEKCIQTRKNGKDIVFSQENACKSTLFLQEKTCIKGRTPPKVTFLRKKCTRKEEDVARTLCVCIKLHGKGRKSSTNTVFFATGMQTKEGNTAFSQEDACKSEKN